MTSNNIEELAAEINAEVAEDWLDGSKVIKERDDYVSWLCLEDAPDLEKLYEDAINKYALEYELNMNEKRFLKDEVYANRHFYDELKDQAFENYNDSEDY